MSNLFDFARLFQAETGSPLGAATFPGGKLRKKTKWGRRGFAILAAGADFLAVLASAALAAVLHNLAHGDSHRIVELHLPLGALAAFFFVAVSAIRNDYAVAHYLHGADQLRRTFAPWCIGFLIALVLALSFMPPGGYALTPIVSLFSFGFAGVVLTRLGLAQAVRTRAERGHMATKRIFLLGFEADLETFIKRFEAHRFGIDIVAAAVLRGPDSLHEDLALARAHARILAPDDVFVLAPWSDRVTIEAAVNAFLGMPAAIHLGPDSVLDRFGDARIAKIGTFSSLHLVDTPLSPSARFTKRMFDLVFASLGLIILAPLFLMVAVAIKLDSPGPIIFRQRRYGFNQQPFRIFKFRSMTTCEDGSKLVAVTSKSDARVTRIGALLRRHNIDELPQLLNVIHGEMSLVGPRPMAVVHDQMFERTIALYARRHNVKPGITGWAQINGCRGGVSEAKIRARVEHDLYYIDHWSLWFDIEILWLTIASKQGYLDAF